MRPRVLTLASAAAAAASAHAAVNAALLRRPPSPVRIDEPVSVLLPVRNEERRVAACLAAALAQRHCPRLEVLVYDDESTDATATVVRAAAGERVVLLQGRAVPAGWLGKPHACAALAAAATGSVLVFVDADVVLAPDALARAVRLLRARGWAFCSPYPRQLAASPLERCVQPLLTWSWLTFLPVRLAERSPRRSLAAANGQFLLVDAAAYRRAGGHAAVRAQVLDDMALARLLRAHGGAGGFVDGSTLASCRMYEHGQAVIAGYTKSLWAAFGPPAGAAGVAALLALLYLLPPAAALAGRRVGVAGYLAAVAGRAVAAARTGGRGWPDSLAHPLSVLALLALTGESWRRHVSGSATWKGRVLP